MSDHRLQAYDALRTAQRAIERAAGHIAQAGGQLSVAPECVKRAGLDVDRSVHDVIRAMAADITPDADTTGGDPWPEGQRAA